MPTTRATRSTASNTISSRALANGPRTLADFFGQFPQFDYNPRKQASTEIGRLSGSGLWRTVYTNYEALLSAYQYATTMESISALPTGPRPLEDFFGQFPHFVYDPQNHASSEIGRLKSSGLWRPVYADNDALMNAYRDAVTMEFNSRYGTDANDLGSWQTLCTRIGLDPVPESLEECREMVMNTHVNIIDLLNVYGTSRTVERFESVYNLSEYTNDTKKYFPRDNAHAGSLLNFLLRHIIDPSKNDQRRRGDKGRKSGKKRRGGRGGGK